MLKKLLAKLQEETKPPCEKTAKKELEEVREPVIKGRYLFIYNFLIECWVCLVVLGWHRGRAAAGSVDLEGLFEVSKAT